MANRNRHKKNGESQSSSSNQASTSNVESGEPRRLQRRFRIRISYIVLLAIIFAILAGYIFWIWKKLPSVPSNTEKNFFPAMQRHPTPLIRTRPLNTRSLKFVPSEKIKRFKSARALQINFDSVRAEALRRFPGRAPRLAIVLGNMKKDPPTLMLLTIAKYLQRLGYMLTIYAMEDGEAHSLWMQIGSQVSILVPEAGQVDWSIFEGVVLSSVETKEVMSSLIMDPFRSIPVVWIVHEDNLGKHLQYYVKMGWEHLISDWRSAFSRADVVVFPDVSLLMLYSKLDTGNFFVICGSPADVWGSEIYFGSHSKSQLRKEHGFHEDDLVVLVIGSSLSYNELSWEYAVATHVLSLVEELKRSESLGNSFKIVFLCGISTDGYHGALQDIASRLGLPYGSVKHYGMDGDVNAVLLMADIALYGSFQYEECFPSLLIRAMSFKVLVIAPNSSGVIITNIDDGVNGMIFQPNYPSSLKEVLVLVKNNTLSRLAHHIAFFGKLHAKNILADKFITGFANLLENILQFPSDTTPPLFSSQIQNCTWEWSMFEKGREGDDSEVLVPSFNQSGRLMGKPSVVFALEKQLASNNHLRKTTLNGIEAQMQDDIITQLEWDDLSKIEYSEDLERQEMDELEERMEKTSWSWEEVSNNVHKAKRLTFEEYERDEGELVRAGRLLCIYEIYSAVGAWPFLHHNALDRGLTLSTSARRTQSDDVDAVVRLPFLNDTFYRDFLCELGAMFSIATKVDSIHKFPWIGFQSWRAVGRKVPLSSKAEIVLERTIQVNTRGDIIYYWARTDTEYQVKRKTKSHNFWSLCDVLNNEHCREVFELAFRQMYGLPSKVAALPPMPNGHTSWSALNCWAMPTPSFLEFVMFSRMFVDSLHSSTSNSSKYSTCLLGSTTMEKKHCYCRMLELLVNVWAYHSGRQMVYINPRSGSLTEKHPVEQRKGRMWAKYFNFSLLKSMDEDMAEQADDGDHPNGRWLWPLSGEVYCKVIHEREEEERLSRERRRARREEEKLRKIQKYGKKQIPLG